MDMCVRKHTKGGRVLKSRWGKKGGMSSALFHPAPTHSRSLLHPRATTIPCLPPPPPPFPATDAINLCSNGFPPGGPSGPCGKTVNDDGTTDPLSGRPGPAFQYCDSSNCPPGAGNFCKRLGDSAANQQMQLLFQGGGQRDVRGYARGVMFNYTGGNTCHNPQNGLFLPRILSFVFECYNGPSLNPPAALVLEETNCVYFIVVKSRYGCPKQCSRNFGDAPCSNAGTCGYDATNGRARCYCNTNFFGDFCEVLGISTGPPQKSYAGNIVGAFFGGLLVGVVGVLGYNFYTATREGGGWREALQLQRLFAGGGAARAAAPYVYKAAPAAEGGGGGGGALHQHQRGGRVRAARERLRGATVKRIVSRASLFFCFSPCACPAFCLFYKAVPSASLCPSEAPLRVHPAATCRCKTYSIPPGRKVVAYLPGRLTEPGTRFV